MFCVPKQFLFCSKTLVTVRTKETTEKNMKKVNCIVFYKAFKMTYKKTKTKIVFLHVDFYLDSFKTLKLDNYLGKFGF